MSVATDILGHRRPKTTPAGVATADWIYRQILDAVLEQRLAPGMKLGEEAVGEIFGASRPVVRTALARLAHEKIVEIKAHRGAFIARPSVTQARQVFEARRLAEEGLVRLCTRKAGKADLARLDRHVRVEKDAASAGIRQRWIRLTGAFHLMVAEIAGNAAMTEFLEDLIAQTSLIISLYGDSARSICCDDGHARIVAAIAAGKEREAVAEMLAHLKSCEASLRFTVPGPERDLRSIFAHVRPVGAGNGR